MSIPTCIAVYFIIWWMCLFMVLPFGVRNAHEAGETVVQGNEAGAPVSPRVVKNVVATTVLSVVVFALVWGQVTYGWIGFDDIPFLGRVGAKG